MATVAVLGLRDKTIFLAARGEQYWLSLLIFFFPCSGMFIGFKLVMLALWWGAATSKLNRHFPFVVATMMSNAPLIPSGRVKRVFYRDHPRDLRSSRLPLLLARIGTAARCGFAPGEVRVICLESQPIHRQNQTYEVHDAALGLLERGHVKVHDMVTRQPWPTDGPGYPVYGVQSGHPLRPVPDADGSVEGLPPMDTAS
ncbi:hypothetical protein CG723_13375 [Streptomyces sp. CB01635]|nr:hypothetical protein CG723_13375 [Streptomyces sp. CB01635]